MAIDVGLTILQNPPAAPVFSKTPKTVGIEITGRCNLRCRHCFNFSGPDNPHEVPLETVVRLLDDMLDWGVKHLRISGGEPTVHRQFREIVAACRDREISIGLNTNGVYTNDTLQFLKTAPIDIFFVSLDGLAANNDAIRGAGTFSKVVESCRQLHAAGQSIMISFHVGQGNRGDVAGLIALAADLGVDVKISPMRPMGRALVELPADLIEPKNYFELVREITELRGRFPDTEIRTDFDILDGPADSDCQRDPGMASCKAGRTMININFDGRIYPCAFFHTPEGEFSAGNIYTDSVLKVWQESPVFQPFRVHQKSAQCQQCGHYQRNCFGGCPAIAHWTTGSLDAHDPTCFADLVTAAGDPS